MAHCELSYKEYTGSIEASIEDECLHGRILFIDDLITYEGQTIAETRAAFEAAVDRYLAHCDRIGKEPSKPYSGTFNVRIGPDLHAKAAKLANRQDVKLNEFVRKAVHAAVENDGIVRHHHQHDLHVRLTADEQILTGHALASGQTTWKESKYVN